MALLFMDGFEYNAGPVATGKWGAGSGTVSSTQARTGTFAVTTTFSSLLTTRPFVTSGGAVMGAAFYFTVAPDRNDIFQVLEGATIHVAVSITAAALLTVKRGSTILATGTHPLVANTWYYLELKTIIDDTVGTYELRINGVAELSATGVDTRNGGTGVWDRALINIGTAGSQTFVDDFYLCDTSGSAPRNTFLGSVKVETLLPQTDAVAAGSNAGLTPSTGTDHGALVDENPPNTSDFNSASTVGLKDTYQYPSMTLTGTILGIQTNLYVNKADAVVRQVCAVVRAGGTDYDGANVSPTTTFTYQSEIRAQNPNTAADWTTTDIASLQVGMKVTV